MFPRSAVVILWHRTGVRRGPQLVGSLKYSSDAADRSSTSPPAIEKKSEIQEKKTRESSKDQPQPARSKLMTVLAGMRVDSSTNPQIEIPREPSRKSDFSQPEATTKRTREERPERRTSAKVDPQLVDAVDRVAEAFAPKIDPRQTKSELIGILVKHAEHTEEARKHSPGELSHLLAGMKIDRVKPRPETGTKSNSRIDHGFDIAQQPIRSMMEPSMDHERRSGQQQFTPRRTAGQSTPDRMDLFAAEPLGIFTNLPELMSNEPKIVLKTWAELEKQELQKHQQQPPNNAFEEMAVWTRQGKLWRFPINNEQDFPRENEVEFSEHVFLDHLIADFPRKGPIKQFMDVVIYALSCNPYISVAEKKDHVDWMRNYFKEKRPILVEVMGEELCAFDEIPSVAGSTDPVKPAQTSAAYD